ncbi:DDE_3 domain-containing protein [Trichonephila clavipes]|nr:DDE_3 domain-containing protein [Trichonephila clavipes]
MGYREGVFKPNVHLFTGAVGPDFVLMDDTAMPHRAHLVDKFLENVDIRRIDWPVRSPGPYGDEAHFWLNGYVNKQNCRIWSEANPQVYVETPLHPEKLTVWCALWAGGILLQKR